MYLPYAALTLSGSYDVTKNRSRGPVSRPILDNAITTGVPDSSVMRTVSTGNEYSLIFAYMAASVRSGRVTLSAVDRASTVAVPSSTNSVLTRRPVSQLHDDNESVSALARERMSGVLRPAMRSTSSPTRFA